MNGTLPISSPNGIATTAASPKPAPMRARVGPRLSSNAPLLLFLTQESAIVLTRGIETGSIHFCADANSQSTRISTTRRNPGQRLSIVHSRSGCRGAFFLNEDAGEQPLPQLGEVRMCAGFDLIPRRG